MRLRAADLHNQSFKVSFRGFDPVEVDGFLKRVADELERLADEKSNLELELDVERAGRKSLEEALESTGQLQAAIVEKAKEEAKLITGKAKLEADRAAFLGREEVARLKREVSMLEERRIALLSEASALAHGLADWVKRHTKEASPVSGNYSPESVLEEELPLELEPFAEEGGDDDLVLDDNRSQMLMDLVANPESYTPPAKRKGPSVDEEAETFELAEPAPKGRG